MDLFAKLQKALEDQAALADRQTAYENQARADVADRTKAAGIMNTMLSSPTASDIMVKRTPTDHYKEILNSFAGGSQAAQEGFGATREAGQQNFKNTLDAYKAYTDMVTASKKSTGSNDNLKWRITNDISDRLQNQVYAPHSEMIKLIDTLETAIAGGKVSEVKRAAELFARGIAGLKGVASDKDIARLMAKTLPTTVQEAKYWVTGKGKYPKQYTAELKDTITKIKGKVPIWFGRRVRDEMNNYTSQGIVQQNLGADELKSIENSGYITVGYKPEADPEYAGMRTGRPSTVAKTQAPTTSTSESVTVKRSGQPMPVQEPAQAPAPVAQVVPQVQLGTQKAKDELFNL